MSRRAYAKLTTHEACRIIALRAEGLTFELIAARIGCSKASVCNVLQAYNAAAIIVDQGAKARGVQS